MARVDNKFRFSGRGLCQCIIMNTLNISFQSCEMSSGQRARQLNVLTTSEAKQYKKFPF